MYNIIKRFVKLVKWKKGLNNHCYFIPCLNNNRSIEEGKGNCCDIRLKIWGLNIPMKSFSRRYCMRLVEYKLDKIDERESVPSGMVRRNIFAWLAEFRASHQGWVWLGLPSKFHSGKNSRNDFHYSAEKVFLSWNSVCLGIVHSEFRNGTEWNSE